MIGWRRVPRGRNCSSSTPVDSTRLAVSSGRAADRWAPSSMLRWLIRPPACRFGRLVRANQYSYEFEEANTKTAVVRGGAFLSLLTQAFAQGGNVQKPEDGWPLEFLDQASELVPCRNWPASEKAVRYKHPAWRAPNRSMGRHTTRTSRGRRELNCRLRSRRAGELTRKKSSGC